MVLIFLSVLQVLYIQCISIFALCEIKLQFQKMEHLQPKEANLAAKIPMKLLLHMYLNLAELQWQCHLFTHILDFGLCLFIEVCQNTSFKVFPGHFVFSSVVIVLSTGVWFLTTVIRYVNCSGKKFPL